MSCVQARDLMTGGPAALERAGFECRIVDEDFSGPVVRISRECSGPRGATLSYVTLS